MLNVTLLGLGNGILVLRVIVILYITPSPSVFQIQWLQTILEVLLLDFNAPRRKGPQLDAIATALY
jgi:hypothetical protein